MFTCIQCDEEKAPSCFGRDNRRKDGLSRVCKPCLAERSRKWREKNPEKAAEMARKTREKNAEKIRERSRKWHIKNRQRHLKYMRDRRENQPDAVKDSRLKSQFGITLQDYKNLLKEQEGRCAICGRQEDEFDRALSVDHCHESGNVRGFLCSSCNTGLGQFQDSITNLKKAIQYLLR